MVCAIVYWSVVHNFSFLCIFHSNLNMRSNPGEFFKRLPGHPCLLLASVSRNVSQSIKRLSANSAGVGLGAQRRVTGGASGRSGCWVTPAYSVVYTHIRVFQLYFTFYRDCITSLEINWLTIHVASDSFKNKQGSSVLTDALYFTWTPLERL